MTLTAGARVGRYEIVAFLGAGGMGEVYRARDTALNRDVALKVLPDRLTTDPDRLARLTREAQLLASLSHTNIAGVYGLEQGSAAHSGPAVAMELVDGWSLADRIIQGPLPFDEALAIARQIASALEAAHEHGIIHRDLKPANIKVRPDGSVKVLDFGLAKLTDSGIQSSPRTGMTVTASPTVLSPAMITGAGVILGTAAYMSPEQARGRDVDKRADIWAFGVVLYEMLVGRRAFPGDGITEVAGAVIYKDPDWSALPRDTPSRVTTVLRRCLEKDPSQRLRDIGDARLALDGAFDAPVTTTTRPVSARRPFAALAAVAMATFALTAAGVWWLARPERAAASPVRFGVSPPSQVELGQFFALSPNGRHLAFLAVDGTATRLWVHSFETGESQVLLRAGMVSGAPFWSPDSQSIGFAGEGFVKKIDLSGGPPATVAEGGPFAGATWSEANQIVFAVPTTGLMQVSANGGGTPMQLTALDKAREEVSHTGPWFLPGGTRFLYLRSSSDPAQSGIYVGTIGTPPDKQDLTRLLPAMQNALYARIGNGTGHLLFMRDGMLLAQPFDPETLSLSGEAERLAERIGTGAGSTNSFGFFSVSATGALAYRHGESTAASAVWVLPTGQEDDTIASALERPINPQLSPDGRRLALIVGGDVWVYDVGGRPPIRLTSGGNHFSPLWSPDGRTVAFEQNNVVAALPSDGSDLTPKAMSPAQGHFHPYGWSPDGRELVLVAVPGPTKTPDILRFTIGRTQEPEVLVATPANEGGAGAALSPNGRWLAYVSNQTGRGEVWVRPYREPGAAVRISPNGGLEPVWGRDGRTLFYREVNRFMRVAVTTSGEFTFTPSTQLFESRYLHTSQPPTYDVAADGRFIMLESADPTSAPFHVVLEWPAALPSARTR